MIFGQNIRRKDALYLTVRVINTSSYIKTLEREVPVRRIRRQLGRVDDIQKLVRPLRIFDLRD